MNLAVCNETAPLESVILGIGVDRGQPRGINPMIRKHMRENTSPTEARICSEIRTFEKVLLDNGVQVYRPMNLNQTEQIFTRDIGFVIEDYFFVSNMKYAVRAVELDGIKYILDEIDPNKIIEVPKDVIIEGGDIILWDEFIFVGLGERTNEKGLAFLADFFPNKTVLGFDLVVDPIDVNKNILHLDCTFQPIGQDQAIIYLDGFKAPPSALLELFPADRLIKVNLDEKNKMFPNIFSISPTKIVIEQHFYRLKEELQQRGFEVFEVEYSETSKLSGLLRCSTLPLKRKGMLDRN